MSQELLEQYGLRPKAPEAIDSSMLKDYLRCRSYFYLRHVLGLARKRETAVPALDWGTKWHEMQEVFNRTGDLEQAVAKIDPWPDSIQPESDRHGRSRDRMMMQFVEYQNRFLEKDRNSLEIISVEDHFDLWDEKSGLRWSGRMDRVVRNVVSGKIRPWDYKTTSWMTQFYWEGHEHGFQCPGYVWATQRLTGEKVTDLTLDVLYTLKNTHDFLRRTFRYTDNDLLEWETTVLGYLREIGQMLRDHLYDPEAWLKDKTSCTDFNKLCSFASIHFRPAERDTRLRILQEDYMEDRWDPIKAGD